MLLLGCARHVFLWWMFELLALASLWLIVSPPKPPKHSYHFAVGKPGNEICGIHTRSNEEEEEE
jgi:hypothetical protein